MKHNASTGRYNQIVTRPFETRQNLEASKAVEIAFCQANASFTMREAPPVVHHSAWSATLAPTARFLLLTSVLLFTAPVSSFAGALAQEQQQEQQHELPPEEDESYATPEEYSFNPVQAQKELKVAKFYIRKGSHRAAALRLQEVVKWDESVTEAYLLLGESREKTSDLDGALQAYRQFLEHADDGDKARAEVQKRIRRLDEQARKEGGAAKAAGKDKGPKKPVLIPRP